MGKIMAKDLIKFIYVTFKNKKEAAKIGKYLVEKQLAKCVNILPTITSIYEWEGKVEKASEVNAIIKIKPSNVKKVTETIKLLHSYSNPCILSIEAHSLSDDYTRWFNS